MALLIRAAPHLATGLLITIMIALGGIAVALVAAFAAGLARRARSRVIRMAATIYVEFFRGTSALVQLYWLYYALPLIGIVLPATLVGIFGLGLCMGAYGAEVVRSAIAAIPQGQFDAAASVGLRPLQQMRLVILPQALRIMLPQFANLAIELIKSTALVSLVTLHDLTFEAQMINQETLRTLPVFTAILVLYYLLAQLVIRGVRVLERRGAVPGLR